MYRIFLAVVAVAVSGLPVEAASILDPLLGSPGDCYYRFYDAAHLRSHKRQVVQSIFVTYDTEYQDPLAELTLYFGLTTRDGKKYEGVGICNDNVCGVEGDGGSFTLTPYRDGLRLDVDPRQGMSAEGAQDFINLGESDDTVFLLSEQSPRACDY